MPSFALGAAPRSGGRRRRIAVSLVLAGALGAAAACAPSTGPTGTGAATDSASGAKPQIDSDFDLEALVAEAKKEGSVTVYDSTGDITETAAAFTAKYGIKATGVKSKVGDTLEKMTRENQAGNVTIDATFYEDGPSLVGQLLAQKVVYTWIPGSLVKDIPPSRQSPLQVLSKGNMWIYNPKLFPKGCPVKNIWDLADPAWKGKVAMQDPLGKPNIVEFFNQLKAGGEAGLRQAYKTKYRKELASGDSAAEAWVKGLAKNGPILTSSDDDATAAVASPNQTKDRVALVSNAKFRDVKEKSYSMRVCAEMQPWSGYQYPKYAAVATKTKHPAAAKLFVYFMLTQQGVDTQLGNGGLPGNPALKQGTFLPDGLTDWNKQLFVFDPSKLKSDFDNLQPMQDLWRLNHG
ncbi:iron(III) transport system substrate-binding protein [Streptomyces sp. 2131.1]|uniref:ABC transporter substrate-binding protein n=1 Tax=Streptomyces sp. 2131.1 TaxID=1855346 RepID=UPI00089A7B15|nr:ABC transporter substrate-binding protein [Streptomyces sp. 2131.1]SEE49903.1 iron(III) transport system substrate-binding protein [Streptomyces sp. 2131.1]